MFQTFFVCQKPPRGLKKTVKNCRVGKRLETDDGPSLMDTVPELGSSTGPDMEPDEHVVAMSFSLPPWREADSSSALHLAVASEVPELRSRDVSICLIPNTDRVRVSISPNEAVSASSIAAVMRTTDFKQAMVNAVWRWAPDPSFRARPYHSPWSRKTVMPDIQVFSSAVSRVRV